MDTLVLSTPAVEIRSQFLNLAESLEISSSLSSQWLVQILAHYSEPQRHYHTLSHISSMLRLLANYQSRMNDAPAVMLAIFFHDIIYDPKAKDNELRSIECFKSFAGDVDLKPDIVAAVKESIECTISHTLVGSASQLDSDQAGDLQLFLDFDLEVLSRDEAEYAAYAAQIRKEYGHFSDREYCAGRIKVLESFLARKRLYFSEEFHGRCEDRARANIKNEINDLQRKLEAAVEKT